MRVFKPLSELPYRGPHNTMLGGLWFSQEPDWSRPRVAIIGSRDIEPPTADLTRRIAGEIATAGIDVCSGGAHGVDEAAHLGCLDAKGPGQTWLVSPVGLDRVAPPANKPLFARVAREGTLVSCFEHDARLGARWMYHARNRALTALVDLVIVVQAGDLSGSEAAATHALADGVPCVFLSGSIHDPRFEGSRRLARKPGARWVHALDELHELVTLATAGRGCNATPLAHLAPTAQTLLRFLVDEPCHVDSLSQQSGLPMAELAPALLTLSLDNVIKEGPAGFWALGPDSPQEPGAPRHPLCPRPSSSSNPPPKPRPSRSTLVPATKSSPRKAT